MKMHSSSPLRIRPPMARVPRRLAANPSQIPRTFSTGATNTTRRPLSPRSWKINQHPRKNVSGPRAPKSREKVATPFYRLVPLARQEVARSHVAPSRPYRQHWVARCCSPGRAWRTRGCHRKLRCFGVAATSHPQPFTFNIREVLPPSPSPNPLEQEDTQAPCGVDIVIFRRSGQSRTMRR